MTTGIFTQTAASVLEDVEEFSDELRRLASERKAQP